MVDQLRSRPIFYGVLAAMVVFGVCNTLSFWPLTIDDSYISLRYAHWMVQGEGLVYNPGEHVEGFSNPPWVILMALGLALGFPSLVASKLLGVLCHAFSIVAVAGLALELVTPKRRTAWVAVAVCCGLLAVSLPANFWPITGMETTFYGAMIMATYWRLMVELRSTDARPWSAILAAITALTRPEAPLVVLGAWLARAWAGRADRQGLLRWMTVFFVPTVGYLLFRLMYYGFPLANTYYQKGHAGTVDALELYLRPWLSIEAPLAVFGFLGLACLGWQRRQRAWPVMMAAGGLVFFVVWVSWDWMDNQRFIVPALPMWVMGVAAGAALFVERIPEKYGWWVVGACTALLGFQGWQSLPLVRTDMNGEMVELEPRSEELSFPGSLVANWHGHGSVPVWAMEAVPPDGSIAFTDIGMLGWVGDWTIVDLAGLTDKHTSGATGLDWDGRAAYIGERAPDFIILKTGGVERFQAITSQPWLLDEYELMDGPRGAIAARRRDARWATDAEILANYELATTREPNSRRFVWRRAMWAAAVGTQEQLDAACALIRSKRSMADLVEKCEGLSLGRVRPDTAIEPLRESLARRLPRTPDDPTPRTDGVRPAVAAVERAPSARSAPTPPPPLDAPRPSASADNPFREGGRRGVGVEWAGYPLERVMELIELSDGVLTVQGHGEEDISLCGPLLPAQAGSVARVSGAWQTDAEGASLFLVILDADNRKIRTAERERFWRFATADGPRGWGPLEHAVTLPARTEQARVCLDFRGTGAAAFSDVRLQIDQP